MSDNRSNPAHVASRVRRIIPLVVCCVAVSSLWSLEVLHGQPPAGKRRSDESGNYDARHGLTRQPVPGTMAVQARESPVPGVVATFDEQFGTTRTLMNPQGYLTPDDRKRAPLDIALDYIRANVALLGLEEGDIEGIEITDVVPNLTTGSTHVYLRQTLQGMPVHNGQLHVNVNRDGRIISVNNAFVPGLAASAGLMAPSVSAAHAVSRASSHLRLPLRAEPRVLEESAAIVRETRVDHAGISTEPIEARLMLLPIQRGVVRLVWNFRVHSPANDHAFDFTVDAESGKVWTRADWTSQSQYLVYPQPVESPNHTSPLPPADGRTIQVNPENVLASPYGWHDVNGVSGADYTVTRGNNVHAYHDSDADNLPPALEVDCGPGLLCNFPLNLLDAPGASVAAAVTNLFYWTNIVHDVQYQYGFTEAAGNFQVNTYGRGGIGNDDLRAEALDGSGTNNANMFTPPDGQRPRMQMYVWTATSPFRTSDLDATVIVHEYGHGISNRLVGGPSNVGCLSNVQQPGEGLSDWWAMAYTARTGDTGPLRRGMGTYLLGQPTSGQGIRGQPYSTDPAINTWTYESISGAGIPHGVGAVWAQAAWEMYWALVNRHGFDPNLYDAVGGAGNQRAMLYVNEGLMNAPCSPTFTEVRDGILQAAIDNHGGEDVCLLWDAFAGFGLGADAVSGGSNSLSATNGFAVPFFCLPAPPPAVSVGDATVGEAAGTANVSLSLSGARPYPVHVSYATSDHTAKAAAASVTYSNPAPILIPTVGPAAPYPSFISVPASVGTVTGVTVTLHGFSHTYLADLNVLLVGPAGQRVMLMSGVPVFGGFSGSLTFSDAGDPFPQGLSSGVVRPSGPGAFPILGSPAPGPPYGNALSALLSSPDGQWSLFIYDPFTFDEGNISGGWSLTFTTGDYVPTSSRVTFAPGTTGVSVSVPIVNDGTGEAGETFHVNVTNVANATSADAQGVVTIVDDDGGPPPPPPNPLADIVIDFGAAGLWGAYNPAGTLLWNGLHPANTSLIVPANLDGNEAADLAVVFPGFGLYLLMNGTTWVGLHYLEPAHVAAGDLDGNGIDELAISFPGNGLWIWANNASWLNLHWLNPLSIAMGNVDSDPQHRSDLIVSFPDAGMWIWKNHAGWHPIHAGRATRMITGDLDGNGRADVVAQMQGLGLWVFFNDAQWMPLLGATATGLAIGNLDADVQGKEDVIVSFAGYGTWVWFNNSTWVPLHGTTASVIAAGSLDADPRADLVLVFPGFGVYTVLNGGGFTRLHPFNAEALAIARFDGS
jgi:extracellular elastinolytic metalloproteinase